MWKMYTPDMQGVRIKMNEFPFKKHIIHPGQFSNKEQIETYINATERDEKGLPYILNTYPQNERSCCILKLRRKIKIIRKRLYLKMERARRL